MLKENRQNAEYGMVGLRNKSIFRRKLALCRKFPKKLTTEMEVIYGIDLAEEYIPFPFLKVLYEFSILTLTPSSSILKIAVIVCVRNLN